MEVKIKMDKMAIVLSSVVGILGLLSAIMGFAGEGTNSTNPSPGLGICGAIFLLAAQIIVTAVGGCCGCCKSRAIPSETKRIVGIICAVGSWILTVVACVLFSENAAANTMFLYHPGMYAGAAVLALFATALCITSFITLRAPPADAAPGTTAAAAPASPNKAGDQQPAPVVVTVGQPQFPQAAAAAGAPNS